MPLLAEKRLSVHRSRRHGLPFLPNFRYEIVILGIIFRGSFVSHVFNELF